MHEVSIAILNPFDGLTGEWRYWLWAVLVACKWAANVELWRPMTGEIEWQDGTPETRTVCGEVVASSPLMDTY